MFSQTIYMEQVSTKNHLTLAKTNRVSQYTLSIQMLFKHKYKGSSKKYPFIIFVMSTNNESINLKLPKYQK